MISQKILNCEIALEALMHQVAPEQAEIIRIIKTNLIAVADQAEEMEGGLIVPHFKIMLDAHGLSEAGA